MSEEIKTLNGIVKEKGKCALLYCYKCPISEDCVLKVEVYEGNEQLIENIEERVGFAKKKIKEIKLKKILEI